MGAWGPKAWVEPWPEGQVNGAQSKGVTGGGRCLTDPTGRDHRRDPGGDRGRGGSLKALVAEEGVEQVLAPSGWDAWMWVQRAQKGSRGQPCPKEPGPLPPS